MSIHQLYAMSRRSFSVYSAKMNVAGDNIANASTPGFSRRRLTLAAQPSAGGGIFMQSPYGAVGSGVTVQSYERMRDGLLAASSWDAQTGLGGSEEEARLLTALEGLFGVNSGASLTDVMDGFWNSWSDLANNPTDPGARSTVLNQATSVTDTLGNLNSTITTLGNETQSALAGGVQAANSLLSEIASLNTAISAARAGGTPDLAAEDRRDAAVAELAAFVPVDVNDGPEGYTVSIGGMAAVQGDHVQGLTLDTPPDVAEAGVRFTGTSVSLPTSTEGSIGAQLRTLNETIPNTLAALDTFAADLVEQVNAIHELGFSPDGAGGQPFFDPTGLTAGTISVAVTELDEIAASGSFDADGDSSQALAIANLRSGFDEQAIGILTDVGSSLQQAMTQAGAHAAVASHFAAMEQGVSGVSLDEEMTHLLEAQHAFAAAARVLDTAEQMMDTVLAL